MSDTPQTIQQQLDIFAPQAVHAVMAQVQLGTFLAGQIKPITDSVARTVTSNVLLMDTPGEVVAAVATAGGSGIYLIGPDGATTATKQCTVAYDINGFATITFHAADGVTAAKITYKPLPYTTNPDGTQGLGRLLSVVPQ